MSFRGQLRNCLRKYVPTAGHSRRRRLQSPVRHSQLLEQRRLLAADFGDAPMPYPVSLADDGARHEAVGPQLGKLRTAEADGVNSPNAAGDDGDDSTYFGQVPLYAGVRLARATVRVDGTFYRAYLNAWIDFNADGDWTDPGEQVADDREVRDYGPVQFSFDVPADAAVGQTYARFRLSTQRDLEITGPAPDGEVEDIPVEILFGAPTPNDLVHSTVVASGTLRPEVTWDAVPGAERYEVWVQRFGGGPFATGNLVETAIVDSTSWTPDFDLPIGQGTRLWMRSIAASGETSVWSRQFRIFINGGVATNFQPLDKNQLTTRPVLTWDGMVGATHYDLWISNVTTGTSQVIRETVHQQTFAPVSFTPVVDLPIGKYRAWVQVAASSGGSYDWSAPVDFCVVTPPVATAGVNSTFHRSPEFSWQPVDGAESYELRLVNRNTGVVVHNRVGLSTPSWTPPEDLTDGPYRWQVIAVGTNGFRSQWSDPAEIYVGGQTELISPQNGERVRDLVTFSWNAVDGAESYELLALRYYSTGAAQRIFHETDITQTSVTLVMNRPSLGERTVRVWIRAVSAGETAPWSGTPFEITILS